MKSRIRLFFLVLAVALTVVSCAPRERVIVLLSTNDMHAKIQRFPQLATAVAACRDTAEVVLVDAGDRWTGNAYVDMAPTPGMPILALMNRLGYDAATLGNHEFDNGQAYLGGMLDSVQFSVVCANVLSDTVSFPQLPPYVIVEREGLKIGVVGVVTNYEGYGHPAGSGESFIGLRFPDPQQAAARYGRELRDKCDAVILLSHMGDDRDLEFMQADSTYDLIIGGHTHIVLDTLVHARRLTQTGKDLKNIGATTLRFKGNKLVSADYRMISLADYQPDAAYQAEVDRYYDDPTLNKPVGKFGASADKWGLANWMAEVVADAGDAQIGIYHIGGVRIDSLPAGDVSIARVYDLEPFGTQIVAGEMTPADLRQAILAKYNDTINRKEAHRIDMIATTPYVIVTDAADQALDVLFPALREGQTYTVAMADYIFKTYSPLKLDKSCDTGEAVVRALLDDLDDDEALMPDNRPRQQVRRK